MLVTALSGCLVVFAFQYSGSKPIVGVLLPIAIAITSIIGGISTDNSVRMPRNDWSRCEVEAGIKSRASGSRDVRVSPCHVWPANVLNLLGSHLMLSGVVPQNQVMVLFKPGYIIGVPTGDHYLITTDPEVIEVGTIS